MNINQLKQKLTLGTVQLGLQYGINNQIGKPDKVEAFNILSKAASEHIYLLDSAEAYGDSLAVIGNYQQDQKNSSFRIISKFIGDDEPLNKKVSRTLAQLNQPNLYAYLYHRFSDYKSGKYKDELLSLKNENKIDKLGVSIYSDEEFEAVLNDPDITIIQLPLNPLDSSTKKKDLMKEARSQAKEIHVRSIFLQGLFFKQARELTGNLVALSPTLTAFHNVLNDYKINVRQACLNYALHQPYTNHVIIGVETKKQLEENIESILTEIPSGLFDALEALPLVDTLFLNPSHWKP